MENSRDWLYAELFHKQEPGGKEAENHDGLILQEAVVHRAPDPRLPLPLLRASLPTPSVGLKLLLLV